MYILWTFVDFEAFFVREEYATAKEQIVPTLWREPLTEFLAW
jgi:hypothetical protein